MLLEVLGVLDLVFDVGNVIGIFKMMVGVVIDVDKVGEVVVC